MIDSLRRFLTFRQNDLSLPEYIKQFKELRDVSATQNTECMHYEMVSQTPKYQTLTTDSDKLKMKKEFYEAWVAMIFMTNADWKRYGSLMDDLREGFTHDRNEYPKTLKAAIDMLDSHKVDAAYKEHRKSQEKSKHKDMESNKKSEASFAQKPATGVKCFCCGDPSHKSPDCPYKDKVAKADWFKETKKVPAIAAKNFNQTDASDNEATSDESSVDSSSSQSKPQEWERQEQENRLEQHDDNKNPTIHAKTRNTTSEM